MDTFTKYLLLCLILTIAYIYSIILAPKLINNEKINNIHESCFINCKYNICNLSSRGDNYYINSSKTSEKCMMTFWGFTHVLLYTILGFLFPDMFIQLFLLGIIFEIYEKYKFDCHDTLDIYFNTIGLLIGYTASSYLS